MSSSKKDIPLHKTYRHPDVEPSHINQENVLIYFCNPDNPFYDSNSCNGELIEEGPGYFTFEERLRMKTGTQYILWYSRPPIYIISKIRRNDERSVSPLAYYYIINGVVSQTPDMYSIAQSCLLGSLEPLRNAFEEISKCSRFTTVQGYFWEFKRKSNMRKKEVPKDNHEEEVLLPRSTEFQKHRTNMLLEQIFKEMPEDDALEMLVDKFEECRLEESKPSKEPHFAKPFLLKKKT